MQLLHDRRSACLLFQSACVAFWPPPHSPAVVPPGVATPNPSPRGSGPGLSTATATATTRELASFLACSTPREFRGAVRQSGGRFLYRGDEAGDDEDDSDSNRDGPSKSGGGIRDARHPGESNTGASVRAGFRSGPPVRARIRAPDPDLLLPETYGNDPEALAYFERLEERLSSSFSPPAFRPGLPAARAGVAVVALPSSGHIATSDPLEAGKWGRVVSVWPLVAVADPQQQQQQEQQQQKGYASSKTGANTTANDSSPDPNRNFSYAWPRDRPTFYSAIDGGIAGSDGSVSSSSGTNYHHRKQRRLRDENDRIVVDEQLVDALLAKDGREVLFATNAVPSSAFLTVPMELDNELRDELERIDYGL